MRFAFVPLLAATTLLIATVVAQEERPKLRARVDGRVELMSILFRLAGNPEYNQLRARSPYSSRVDAHFTKFRDHEAVRSARALRRTRGVSYDAVMSLAVHLRDAGTLAERVPFDTPPERLDKRWRTDEARAFLVAARSFAKQSDFAGFLDREKQFHARAANRLQEKIDERDYLAWFDLYFGAGNGARRGANTTVLIGLLNGGGNYGVGVRYPDGREEITPVLGIYQFDEQGLPLPGNDFVPLLVHEVCHSYVNPLVDRHAQRLQAAGAAIYPTVADRMRRQAYTTWKIMLYESLVRASVVRFMLAHDGRQAATRQAADDARRGFSWTADLARLLGEYEADRKRYRTLDAFMPRVAEFFDTTAKRLARAPRVVSIHPNDGDRAVDPATKAIVIRFDRPMRAGAWSVVKTNDPFPAVTGKVTYDAARRVLTIPVRLQANTKYGFSLNSDTLTAFRSAEGVPLKPVRVSFRTRETR